MQQNYSGGIYQKFGNASQQICHLGSASNEDVSIFYMTITELNDDNFFWNADSEFEVDYAITSSSKSFEGQIAKKLCKNFQKMRYKYFWNR